MNKAPLAATRLRLALDRFAAGQLDAARAACRDALRAQPDHAGALHLLGLVAHSSGDWPQAHALLRRAAESPHTNAVYLLSYAELCCKPQDLDAAVDAARRAVALDSTLPLGWLCLGRLLFETRRYDASRECFERALELDPHFSAARCGLANARGRLGDATASSLFEALLAEQPDNADARDGYALLLQDLGRYQDALQQAELAIALRPDTLDFHLRAANIELHLERYWPALERLGAVAIRNHGTRRDGAHRDARLVALQAHLLRLVDRFEEAAKLCRDAIDHGVESAELLRAYGLALQLSGREDEALSVFDKAATQSAIALSDKGVLLTQQGRIPEACDAFDQALAREPTLADAWYNRTSATRRAARSADIAAMERVLAGACTARDRLMLHFALGAAHMQAGSGEAAFRHWHAGNRLKRAHITYDADAASRRMAAIAEEPANFGADEVTGDRLCDLPVFVVGMPRSGSSLIEQILASHPEIHGGGELMQLRAEFENPAGTAPSIAQAVVARLRRLAPRARRIVDKDLVNFHHLGVIHRTFPRARIIHCRRDPLDTCFSAYTKLFVGNLGFTYDLRELGLYYRDYHALMAHWRRELPGEVLLEVDYESLVAEPERTSRRLLDFVGLAWHDDCARFFDNNRPVRTASLIDVRRPVYRSSVGRAHVWQSELEPLIAALGDLAQFPSRP
jgi:tetratricopeptide (TPR) repeat protein